MHAFYLDEVGPRGLLQLEVDIYDGYDELWKKWRNDSSNRPRIVPRKEFRRQIGLTECIVLMLPCLSDAKVLA